VAGLKLRFISGETRRQGREVRNGWHYMLLSLLVAGLMNSGNSGAQTAAARTVLVLFSNGRLLPANVEIDRSLAAKLASRPDLRTDLSVEFLDTPKFGGEAYAATMATYLRDKYAANTPEVIIAIGPEALEFVMSQREQLFPGARVVHSSISKEGFQALPPLPPDVIGVRLDLDFVGTIENALRLQPATRRVAVVTGTSAWDRGWESWARRDAARFADRLSFDFLTGLPTAELQARLGKLPADSIVFTPGFFRDGDGRLVVPMESVRFVAAASTVPVYGLYPTHMGTGVVGGNMANFAEAGELAAQAAIALLDGAAPAAIELPKSMPNRLQLDWRQVQRWGIPPQAVPPSAVVHFKAPSFWESYRQYVLIAAALFLIQSVLIAALLVERRRRRRTAAALAQSEQRMNLAAQAARLSMWIWNLGRKTDGPRTPARRSTDVRMEHINDFDELLAGVLPEDRDALRAAVKQALATGEAMEVDYRVAGADGEARWMKARGRASQDNGQRLFGVTLDITPQKRAEAQAEQDRSALRHMTRVSLLGKLSASIAHQLNQPLASILSNAEAAQTMLRREPVDLAELRAICDDIVAEDHRAAEVIRRLGALFKRGQLQLAPLDVNELVRDTLELTRTNLLTRHVTTLTRLAPDLPKIDGDRVQLQQLLLNLIVNAADAMEATPEAERRLTLSTALSGTHLEVCVADRGPGVPASVLDNVFDAFWSTKPGGMGMGLAICRSIALAHRGSLSSFNAAEGGAVFCVLLPMRSAS
jgi:signal transduction histidine kinase